MDQVWLVLTSFIFKKKKITRLSLEKKTLNWERRERAEIVEFEQK